MKKVLITGGAGFIGSHTTDLLLKEGLDVIVYDNLSSGKLTNLDLFNPRLEFVPGDVLDYPTLRKHLHRVDAVLHLAALPSVPRSIEDPVQSLLINTQGFLHVLQALREIGKGLRCVYASSASIYGSEASLPCLDDDAALQNLTLSPYALDKANNERYADLYARLFGLNALGLRYFNVYGPRQDPQSPYSGVISKFIEAYQKQDEIIIFGDGEQSRDFIYVADVARANFLALTSSYQGVLNIATGVPETLLNLLHYLETVGGRAASVSHQAVRAGDIRASYASIEKAKQQLAFRSATALEAGMRLLLAAVAA